MLRGIKETRIPSRAIEFERGRAPGRQIAAFQAGDVEQWQVFEVAT
jgi:hypothetical protein